MKFIRDKKINDLYNKAVSLSRPEYLIDCLIEPGNRIKTYGHIYFIDEEGPLGEENGDSDLSWTDVLSNILKMSLDASKKGYNLYSLEIENNEHYPPDSEFLCCTVLYAKEDVLINQLNEFIEIASRPGYTEDDY